MRGGGEDPRRERGALDAFGGYARYYDLLYRDKDYAGEAAWVRGVLARLAPGARSVLDLGCGTGAHAAFLAREGYEVHGLDGSGEMLRRAEGRARELPPGSGALSFSRGDVRTARLGRRFDAVVSLFHVMSYQTGTEDLRAAFGTAAAHLGPGGLLLFDAWYGPAVLAERPAVRVKRMEDAETAVVRIAEPDLDADANRVDVRYTVLVRDRATGAVEEIRELHRMRYLFTPEVGELLREAGFSLLEAGEWMTGRPPGLGTWNVFYAARRTP